MNMTTILIIVIVVLILLLLIVLVCGGNYLLGFALSRNSEIGDIAPASKISDAARQRIADNRKISKEKAKKWMAAARVEKVRIKSFDGLDLSGECIVTDPASHRWVIGVHGYRSDHVMMEAVTSYYGENGFNACLPDLRGCGDSGGEYISMGWLDRKDMLSWINWIIVQDPDAQIILHGISMGGATVMMTSGEELPTQVTAIVEDCGYTSVWDIFKDELKYLYHLPTFPLLNVGSCILKIKAGYSFTEASSLKQIQNAKVPILFIHGSEDNFVSTSMVYKLYDACPTEKQRLIIEGAGHGNSYNYNPGLYFSTVRDFIGRYMML